MQPSMRPRLLPILLVLTLAASAGLGSAAPQPVPPEPAADVRELAERLLTYQGPYGPGQKLALLAGQIPSSLPLALPVPPGARVVGTALRSVDARQIGADVVIDSPDGARSVLAFYEQALPALGWDLAPYGPGRAPGGFQPAQTNYNGMFCRGATGPWLTASAWGRASGPSDVRVHVELANPGPCSAPRPPGGGPPGGDLLPTLVAPDGLDLVVNGGGGAPGLASAATAQTDRGTAELEAHFAGQLRTAGWTRLGGASDPILSWSSWRPAGQGDWTGLLYALALPGSKHRSFRLVLESPGGLPPGPPPPMISPPRMAPPPMIPPGAYPIPARGSGVSIVVPPTPTPALPPRG